MFLSRVQSGRVVKLTSHLHLEARLRKSGAAHLSPQVPSRRGQAEIYLLCTYFDVTYILPYIDTSARPKTWKHPANKKPATDVRVHLESKERFAIKKYLLIIGKKKNMQVLSHTFTYFST